MGRTNRIVCAILFTLLSGVGFAQNNTNSPYSRYGYGSLADQGFSKSKAMGGVAYALRDNSQINPLNPASYTAMDSLTFLFEGGISLQNTNFDDGKQRMNVKNSSIDYIAAQFRLKRWMAMSAGVMPLSNVGYRVFQSQNMDDPNPEAINVITREGSGGLHQFYMGVGFTPLKGLSIGTNISYVWGNINHSTLIYFPNATLPSDKSKSLKGRAEMKGVKLDFGVQYAHTLNKKSNLIIGAVFSPKMKLSNDIFTESVQNVVSNKKTSSTFELPQSFGFGASYEWDQRLVVSLDLYHQQWKKAKFLDKTSQNLDYSRVSLGAEYLPKLFSRNYLATIKYRAGAYVANPYYKVDGSRGAREYGVSAGIGLPLPKVRSQLNISAQYVRTSGRLESTVNESNLRLNIGLIFNERWFVKRKI